MLNMTDDILTLSEAAAILRVHTRTLTRWGKASQGKAPLIRLIRLPKGYRVTRAEIERFKTENAQLVEAIMAES